jgi:hypothetical protein
MTLLHSQGKYDDGFENLKWNMTVNKVKMLFASDTISEMSVQYYNDFLMKDNGKPCEHSFQRVKVEINRTNYNIIFSCSFIDDSLCAIAIYCCSYSNGYDKIIKSFSYLFESNSGLFGNNESKYPADRDGWRTDGRVMVKNITSNIYHKDCMFLLRKEIKSTYDNIILQLERDRDHPECMNIRVNP